MLTVVLACDASGNNSTLRPLARSYSVMPSTDGPWLTPGGRAACALQHSATKKTHANTRRIGREKAIMGMWSTERRRLFERIAAKRGEWAWTSSTGESSGRRPPQRDGRCRLVKAPD